jgi:hypothetical protein
VPSRKVAEQLVEVGAAVERDAVDGDHAIAHRDAVRDVGGTQLLG